jgi:hypothetical protein
MEEGDLGKEGVAVEGKQGATDRQYQAQDIHAM